MIDWLIRHLPWYNEKAVTARRDRTNGLFDDAQYATNRAEAVYWSYIEASDLMSRRKRKH